MLAAALTAAFFLDTMSMRPDTDSYRNTFIVLNAKPDKLSCVYVYYTAKPSFSTIGLFWGVWGHHLVLGVQSRHRLCWPEIREID